MSFNYTGHLENIDNELTSQTLALEAQARMLDRQVSQLVRIAEALEGIASALTYANRPAPRPLPPGPYWTGAIYPNPAPGTFTVNNETRSATT